MTYTDDDMGDRKATDDPGFCSGCGRRMEFVEVRDLGFDRATGREMAHLHPRCPRQPRNGWQAFFRGSHDEFCGPGKVRWM